LDTASPASSVWEPARKGDYEAGANEAEALELVSKPHVDPIKWGPRGGFETASRREDLGVIPVQRGRFSGHWNARDDQAECGFIRALLAMVHAAHGSRHAQALGGGFVLFYAARAVSGVRQALPARSACFTPDEAGKELGRAAWRTLGAGSEPE